MAIFTQATQNQPSEEVNNNYWNKVKAQYGIPTKYDIDYYNNYYRFGVFDPYNEPESGREFLFFTKPDLYICQDVNGTRLTNELANNTFFNELLQRWPNVIRQLQSWTNPKGNNPFMYYLVIWLQVV